MILFPSYLIKRLGSVCPIVMASTNTFDLSGASAASGSVPTPALDGTDGSKFTLNAVTHLTREEVKYLRDIESRMNRLVNPADRSSFCQSIATTWDDIETLLSEFLRMFQDHLQPVEIGIWHRFAIGFLEQSPEEIFYTHAERSSGVDGLYRFDPMLTAIPDQIEIYEKLQRSCRLVGSGSSLPIDLGGLQHPCSRWKIKQKNRQLICKFLLNPDFPVHGVDLQEPPLVAGDLRSVFTAQMSLQSNTANDQCV